MSNLVEFLHDGAPVRAASGQSVYAALWAHGIRVTHHTAGNEPRGGFCGIGACFDCLAVVDGVFNVRTCMTPVREGLVVQTQAAGVDDRGAT